MKTKLLLLFGLLLGMVSVQSQEYLEMIDSGTYRVAEIIENAEEYFADRDKGRGTGYKQFKRWEYNAKRLMNEAGYLPLITEKQEELQRYNAYLNETAQNRQSLIDNWTELGPLNWNATTSWNPGVGRITGLAIDKTNSNHIIVGANTGGVWKTTDGGQNWTPLTDTFSNLYVYSVTIDPSNSSIYFFGSNNGLIYKSTDAGATWNLLGTIGNSRVNKIVLHPTNSNLIFATAENAGIYKSTNGGTLWVVAVADGNGYDVEFSPGNPTVVFASGSGFHRSVDGGANFTTIGGFTAGPKMIGVSANNTNIVYVLEAAGNIFGAFYVSSNSGATFTMLNHAGNNYFGYSTTAQDNNGQAPRDMDITVNPNNANEVHIAGILTWRSMNGGVSFTITSDWIPGQAAGANIGYCHADVDIMEFDGNTLFVGTDGGIFKATNTTVINSNYYTDLTPGIGIRQFYKIGLSQTANVVVTGGSQDNGTSFYTAANGWLDWLGADGMEGFVDKNSTNIMYGMIQFGRMYRTDDGAASIINLPEPGQGFGEWVTPFEQDPSQVNTIYIGYNLVYKSINKGGSWTSISQDFFGDLDHLKIAPSNNQIMYAANSSTLYKTTDGGATIWSTITAPGGSINSIAIHPTNPNKVAVATTSSNRVFVSTNGGTSWTNYKLNLPNFSALALVWDDNTEDGLYLGMDYGIWYIDNTFANWQPFSNNLPNVIINELEVNTVDGNIYAGSYGRGLWASPKVIADSIDPVAICQDITVQLDASGSVTILATDIDNGSTDNVGIVSYSIDIDTFTCADVGNPVTVTLTVTDGAGNTDTCTATVTVEDNIDPIALCQDITVQLDASGNATITASDIDNGSSDACGIASLSLDITSFDCNDVNANTVTLTVTDVNGNFSTCTATVTVEDNIAPVALCKDITVVLDGTGNATITGADVDNGSNDACGIASLSVFPDSFDISNLGDNTVTLTVTDNNGNVATCTAIVTVVEILNTEEFLFQNNIMVYPNPAGTEVILYLPMDIVVDIRLFDVSGKQVIYQPNIFISKSHAINISVLNDGIYFVRINSEYGTITKKIIKE